MKISQVQKRLEKLENSTDENVLLRFKIEETKNFSDQAHKEIN